MTIEHGWLASALCIGLLLSCATCVTTSNRRGDGLDVARYPEDIQDAYKVFAVRCSRCHTLARPLNAGITDPQHWVRYVARMRLNSASGINAKNGEVIIRFLQYYTHQREEERREREGEPESESTSPAPKQAATPEPPSAASPSPIDPAPEAQP
jgi:hypothetical protein